jgi:hypothetical protein
MMTLVVKRSSISDVRAELDIVSHDILLTVLDRTSIAAQPLNLADRTQVHFCDWILSLCRG